MTLLPDMLSTTWVKRLANPYLFESRVSFAIPAALGRPTRRKPLTPFLLLTTAQRITTELRALWSLLLA
jgi:hypothetical protein